jgi:hypothetical protein
MYESHVALAWTKDQKHHESGSDNANDDVDQGRAGALSLLRGRSRRFHACLDADRTPGGGLGEELSHGGGYLFNVGFKSEVSRVVETQR